MIQFKLMAMLAVWVQLCTSCNRSNNNPLQKRIVFNPGNLKVITSAVDKKQKRMSVLFGNALAFDAAKHNPDRHRPGEIFTLVTWEEVDNAYWFGATINGKILATETVQSRQSTNGGIQFDYQVIKGVPSSINNLDEKERVQYIISMRPSVFPS